MKNKVFSSYLLIWVIAIIAIVGIITFAFQGFRVDEISEAAKDLQEYKYHFVMIVENRESPFWEDVYESAKEEGEKDGALVELLGENISDEYSVSELLEIAIYQKVDGIILEPSLEGNMEELINEAVEQGIPVVTLMSDAPTSKRQTFVGISKYNLGEKFGEEIIKIMSEDNINLQNNEDFTRNIVVLEPKRDTNSNNVQIYAGIISSVKIPNVELTSLEINNASVFGTEEYIRNIIMETSIKADAIVCLDLVQTESTCQAIIDFNKVGEIRIIGYFVSEMVLEAIETGVIDATYVVDTMEIGEESIKSLIEKHENKRVTDYVSINIEVIDETNVGAYRKNEEKIEQERNNGVY